MTKFDLDFDFGEAIKTAVEAVKDMLQALAESFGELVKTLTKDSVYYQYVHSSVTEKCPTANVIIQGSASPANTVNTANGVSRAQTQELNRPTFNHQ